MTEPTSERAGEREAKSLDATFTCLAAGGRRRVLRRLSAASEPVSREELSDALAAHATDEPIDAVTGDQRERAAVALHHEHLPSLTAAGLVEEDDDGVALADHPALDDSGIVEAIEGDATADDESLDALFGALADARRRTILDVLSHQFGAIHLDTLARELETRAQDVAESEIDASDVDETLVDLHHFDLPRLSDAGLIEYDADEETVAYEGHPDLRVPWTHSVLEPDFRPSLTGESDPGGIGEIEDRERVISFGQSLCDRADDELFCMFTDTGLLENGCLTRIRDAAERDVDVYLGTRDPTIREYVEENAPEVVLWEPNTDWLNLPAAGDRVGRLLLADREAVMLGSLLEEQGEDGEHEEQAIIGEGEHNTLVTMICQLVGPHLESIDEDTEDVDVRLPL